MLSLALLETLQPGDTVVVKGGFGSEVAQTVTIEGLGEKNGRPLFDYTDNKGESRWAYLTQIVRIVERSAQAA